MAQPENPNPRMQLPETWAEKMACPICTSRPLGIFHPTGQADRFACSTCETSFELEDGGKRVRFVTLPKDVTPWMRGQWVILDEALAAFEIFKKGQATVNLAEPPAVEPPAPTPDESVPTLIENVSAQEPVAETVEYPPAVSTDEEGIAEPFDVSKLVRADRSARPKPKTAPFYEEDLSALNNSPDKRIAEKHDAEQEFWKNLEMERVSDAISHPTENDFTGNFTTEEIKPQPQSITPPTFESTFEAARQPEKPVQPVELPQPSWPDSLPASHVEQTSYPSLDNPPPIRPLEDTPPSLIQPPRKPSQPPVIPPGEDLGDLRGHIAVASLAPSQAELIETAKERAIELHKLGNTDQEVRSILERASGLTPEQVAEVLKTLEKPEERKRGSRLILIYSIIAMVIFTLLASWFFNYQSFIISSPGETQSTPGSVSLAGKLVEATNLPAPLQTLIPNGIQIINEEPSVEKSTEAEIPAASCPTTKASAAALFGGPANDWSQDTGTKGWILITKTQGVEVRIPANMSGGFLVFKIGPEMQGVSGPAYVRNVYMITIACE